MNVDLHVEPGGEDVFAQKIVRPGFLDGALQDMGPFRELPSYIYVRGAGVQGETGDEDAFEELVRVVVNDVTILKGTGFGLVRVTDEIDRLLLIRLDKAPLHATGKSRATASAQSGRFHFVHDVDARHGDGLF